MALITDRDLAVIDPLMFADAAGAATLLESVTDGSILGNILTSGLADFAAVNIGAGSVVVAGAATLEVIDRVNTNTLTVSRLRADAADPILPPEGGSALKVTAYTFARLIRQVEDDLRRRVGLDPGDLTGPQIVNVAAMARLTGLLTVAAAYATAAAISAPNATLDARAKLFAERAATALRSAEVELDVDEDGVEDVISQPSLISFTRR